MSESPAKSGTRSAVQAGRPIMSPDTVVEFAVEKASDDLSFESLPAVLERFAGAFGGRAALALRPRGGKPPAVLAAHPHGAADRTVLAQIGALVAEHPELTVAGGCIQAALAPASPGGERDQRPDGTGSRPPPDGAESVLVVVAEQVVGRPSCALVLIGESAHWTAETRSTARALAAVIAGRYRRVSDIAELAEREAVTRAIIEASPEAVVIADEARRIVGFNPAAEALLGRRQANVLGEDMGSLLIPERNRARFIESAKLFLRTGKREYVGAVPLPVLHADGTERAVEMSPLPLVVGGETYFCCFMRDITELQRANAALAASDARFRLLSELAPVGIARTDRGGVCGYVNERWCVLGGGSADEFAGGPWTKVLHTDDAGRVAQEWARARAQGAELRIDCRLRPSGGPQLWVHAAVAALPDGDDHPPGFLVALTNVSARKRAEDQSTRLLAAERATRRRLEDQTERLNSLIAAAIPGVLFVDEHGLIVQLNKSLCDVLGLTDPIDQLIGGPAERLRAQIERTFADPAELVNWRKQTRAARQPVRDVQFACSDGRTIECDYWPVLVGQQYRGDLWLLWDMSERVALEEQRERRLGVENASRQAAERHRA
ncbi:MAG TPA: PAS domain S-box protein [Streptosporangiaceae bacterium]